MEKRVQQKMVVIFLGLLVCINYPVISIFDNAASIAHIPVIFMYLFALMLASIVLIGWVVSRRS